MLRLGIVYRDGRVYGHTTMAMRDNEYTPPPPPPPSPSSLEHVAVPPRQSVASRRFLVQGVAPEDEVVASLGRAAPDVRRLKPATSDPV